MPFTRHLTLTLTGLPALHDSTEAALAAAFSTCEAHQRLERLELNIPGRRALLPPLSSFDVTALMGSVVFCVRGCLPVLLDASFATTANAETVISHLISLDVAGMMKPLHSFMVLILVLL